MFTFCPLFLLRLENKQLEIVYYHPHPPPPKNLVAAIHSRPQSPSFLGHVVGKRGALEACPTDRLQIKPSGSGDENGSNPDDDDGVKNK